MTKKDYELIAVTIKTEAEQNSGKEAELAALEALAKRFAYIELPMTNARFDAYKFLKACGF